MKLKTPYPQVLAGIYSINTDTLVLSPIRIANTNPSEHYLHQIRIVDGLGHAVFSDGFSIALNLKYDEEQNQYTFIYNENMHCFTVSADLSGVRSKLEINILIDFKKMINGELGKI